ncbi:MAG: superoxide dismutase [Anaerolineales bacterium]|nr:superoxide dismutase [Anaerolineales bacterium]
MVFTLPELPYKLNALVPYLSEEQMTFHYTKHHAAYFNKLNPLVEGKPEANLSLGELVVKSSPGGVFNNAAQAWNHTFFWNSMSPSGGGLPRGKLLSAIERDFSNFDEFKKAFTNAAATLFGSGWAWLALDKGKLEIMALSNADTPLKYGKEPLLTIDVWEHAYYIDYRNDRPKFIEGFWGVVNWGEVSKLFEKAS